VFLNAVFVLPLFAAAATAERSKKKRKSKKSAHKRIAIKAEVLEQNGEWPRTIAINVTKHKRAINDNENASENAQRSQGCVKAITAFPFARLKRFLHKKCLKRHIEISLLF
jgi:hypothetical protein